MNVKYLAAVALVMGAAGCGPSIKATTTVNPKVDFSTYDTFFLMRTGGEKATRRERAFDDKDSRRWLSGA